MKIVTIILMVFSLPFIAADCGNDLVSESAFIVIFEAGNDKIQPEEEFKILQYFEDKCLMDSCPDFDELSRMIKNVAVTIRLVRNEKESEMLVYDRIKELNERIISQINSAFRVQFIIDSDISEDIVFLNQSVPQGKVIGAVIVFDKR